ncbi:MAG: efflux RND transporter periplasmic adaptor subunit [Steroidobacteraceae bacterium]|nr:efflux RND transporter periplasmic adaptor subunit [Steroidobacteraceae bacterium]
MMTWLGSRGRTAALLAVAVALLGLFGYVAVRSGPLAPVPVTLAAVEQTSLSPALYGIGTVEARYTHRIGPVAPGRVARVDVQAGDLVRAGQVLGEMDPVDLDERIAAQSALLLRTSAALAAAASQVRDAAARESYAGAQAKRYEALYGQRLVSTDAVEARRQEHEVATAALSGARAMRDAAVQDLAAMRADRAALAQQRAKLRLVAPIDGLVANRLADPGTTLVAGQPVVEVIDPASLWVNVRFDQLRAGGLRASLPAEVVLRSQPGAPLAGRVLRIEPMADAVTEETLAKVAFLAPPQPLPPVGELVEVTVPLPALPPAPVVPNAALQRVDGELGVWVVDGDRPRFVPVRTGATDLDGRVQVLDGVAVGEHVVQFSQRSLDRRSRLRVVERLPGRGA